MTNLPIGKLSSILVSKIIRASKEWNSNLFLIELMFDWSKTNLFKLPSLKDFKTLTQSLGFWLSKDVSESLLSVKIPGIF